MARKDKQSPPPATCEALRTLTGVRWSERCDHKGFISHPVTDPTLTTIGGTMPDALDAGASRRGSYKLGLSLAAAVDVLRGADTSQTR